MKRILLALIIVAIALAVAADEEPESTTQAELADKPESNKGAAPASASSATSESGIRKYSGSINFDLFGSSSVQQTIAGLARAFQEALRLVGVNHTLSQNLNNTGRLQGNFEFSGVGNKKEKKSNRPSEN